MHKSSLLLALALSAASIPASASAINTGQWYHILTSLGNNASGGPDGSPVYFAPNAPPWTFTLLAAGTLDFTDAQNPGDTVQVFNNGASLTATPAAGAFDPQVSCGFDPTACFADSRFAHVVGFGLGAGSYSLNFVATASPTLSSSGFFRINGTAGTSPIPEPSTYALTASAAIAIALLNRRRR